MSRTPEVQIKKDVEGVTVYGSCRASALSAFQRHGWTLVDDGTSETDPEDTGADDDEGTEDEYLDLDLDQKE